MAQSFTPSANVAWNAYEVIIQARIGAPSDSLRGHLERQCEPPGVPGVQLAAGRLQAASERRSCAAHGHPPSPLALNFGTTYWVVVERTGSPDATHMFGVGLDEALGHAGALKIWKVNHWEDRVPNCDMPFEVGQARDDGADWGHGGLGAAHCDHRGAERHLCAPVACGRQHRCAEAEELLAAGTAAGVACWLMFRPSGWCASLPNRTRSNWTRC